MKICCKTNAAARHMCHRKSWKRTQCIREKLPICGAWVSFCIRCSWEGKQWYSLYLILISAGPSRCFIRCVGVRDTFNYTRLFMCSVCRVHATTTRVNINELIISQCASAADGVFHFSLFRLEIQIVSSTQIICFSMLLFLRDRQKHISVTPSNCKCNVCICL